MTDSGEEIEPAPDNLADNEFIDRDGIVRTFPRGSEDAEQADWLAQELKHSVRFNYATKSWHHWNGLRWAPDKTKDVQELVYRMAYRRLSLIGGSKTMGEKKRTIALKVVRRLLEQNRCESALDVLATTRGYKTDGSDWDQVPHLLGVKNGILDLRTGKLDTSPDPTTLVTKSTNVNYNPDAKCPRFMRFLDEVTTGDPQLALFFIVWFGYSLFGHTQEQRFLILTGLGRNGKGALATIMRHVFGEYSAKASPNLYMQNKFGSARSSDARSDLIQLKGMRAAIMSEPEGGKFNEEMLKAHTGGDPIVARPLYGKEIEWLPTHSITFLTNKPPSTDDIGPSMAARVMVADFRERYEGDREDRQLYDKLIAEAEGVLAALVTGALAWYQARDRGGLLPFIPKRVEEASRAYLAQNDPIGRALNEAFVIDRTVQAGGKELHDAYLEWHTRDGQADDPMSITAFGLALHARGFTKKRMQRGVVYTYIRPKTAMEMAQEVDDAEAAEPASE